MEAEGPSVENFPRARKVEIKQKITKRNTMNKKIILLNQLVTDVMELDDNGIEREIEAILNKLKKLIDMEEGELEQAEKEDALESERPEEPEEEVTEEEFMDALS